MNLEKQATLTKSVLTDKQLLEKLKVKESGKQVMNKAWFNRAEACVPRSNQNAVGPKIKFAEIGK